MEQELKTHLFQTAARLASVSNMSEQTIGQRAISDNTFFKRVREGAGFTVKTYDRVMAWMEQELQRDTAQ